MTTKKVETYIFSLIEKRDLMNSYSFMDLSDKGFSYASTKEKDIPYKFDKSRLDDFKKYKKYRIYEFELTFIDKKQRGYDLSHEHLRLNEFSKDQRLHRSLIVENPADIHLVFDNDEFRNKPAFISKFYDKSVYQPELLIQADKNISEENKQKRIEQLENEREKKEEEREKRDEERFKLENEREKRDQQRETREIKRFRIESVKFVCYLIFGIFGIISIINSCSNNYSQNDCEKIMIVQPFTLDYK